MCITILSGGIYQTIGNERFFSVCTFFGRILVTANIFPTNREEQVRVFLFMWHDFHANLYVISVCRKK